jgi:hypothetical protein
VGLAEYGVSSERQRLNPSSQFISLAANGLMEVDFHQFQKGDTPVLSLKQKQLDHYYF